MDAIFPALRDAALAVAVAAALFELVGRGRRAIPTLGAALLLALMAWRGAQIAFVPFTNKYESFVGFGAILLAVLAARYPALGRPGRVLLGVGAIAFLGTSTAFDAAIHYPSPLLVTVWYLAHVPLAFLAYALWLAAAGDGLDYALGAANAGDFRVRQESNVRWGLAAFSLAMIFGAVWGVVSWGAYFLWDAKILWSLAAWVYFATFAHLRYWPVPAGGGRVAIGLIGLVVVLVTFVGTSFMTGSIHAF